MAIGTTVENEKTSLILSKKILYETSSNALVDELSSLRSQSMILNNFFSFVL